MKKCPFCAEEIQDEAVKCKHCGEYLDKPKEAPAKAPWYYKGSSMVVAFLVAGPFMLPMVWFNPKLSLLKKVLLTAVIIVVTYLLIQWMAATYRHMFDFSKQLAG